MTDDLARRIHRQLAALADDDIDQAVFDGFIAKLRRQFGDRAVAVQTPEGVQDLAGNGWEWTSSIYTPYLYHPRDGREPQTNIDKKVFTLRGNLWIGDFHVAQRLTVNSENRMSLFGFRLAADLPT